MTKLWQNSKIHWSIITLLAIYHVVRMVVFANTYGGLEHDSGWFLGISRMLAERGSYVTMVSSVANPAPGGHENIYGQYKVQDEAGRIYFFPESIGAPGIIPNAIIIRLFGAGFWQYRAGPLLFFFIGALLASYLLYQVGGLPTVVMMHLFLFFYPHLIIFLGYEAMGEIFSLTYILLAFVLFIAATQATRHRLLCFLACGLAAGLAFTTKTIALMSLVGLGLAWLLLYQQKRSSLKEILILAGGALFVRAVWELIQLMTLTLLFDFQTYLGFIGQHLDFFLNEGGSGVGERGPNNLDFFWHKITITREISALSSDTLGFIVFLIVLLGGPLLIWRFFRNEVQRNIVTLLWSGWLAHSLWFVLLSKGGWVRHNWHALMLAVLLLSLITAHAWQSINRPPQWINRVTALFLAGVLLIGFAHQTEAATFFISDRLVERWYQDQLAADHTRIPWGLVPRDAQENVLDFLEQLPASARIFYPEGHKSAEMAVMSGRVLYPIERRPYMPPAKGDVALIGPSLISRWRKPNETHVTQAQQQAFVAEVLKQVKRECPEILFENDYYIICGLD